MKVRFKETSKKTAHGSRGIFLKDGGIAEVSHEDGQHLFKHWPDNFEQICLRPEELGPRIHEPLQLSEIAVITLQYSASGVLEENLLPTIPHEVEFIKLENTDNQRWHSIAEALNYGIRNARNDILVWVHEDVKFSETWFQDLIQQECTLKDWGALGIQGLDVDRKLHWGSDYTKPQPIPLLDECCIVVNRLNGLLFDEKTFTGVHRYGFDFCFQCQEASLGVYLVTGMAYHNQNVERHPSEWFGEVGTYQGLLEQKWGGKFPNVIRAIF